MITKERVKTAIFIVLWLSFFGVIVGTSPSFQACVGERYQHEAGDSLQKGAAYFIVISEGFAPCLGEFVHKNAEAIIALFTIILGIATWLLWRATDRLVRGADKTAERQLRAYIHVFDVKLSHVDDDWSPVIRINIKNFGKTPALKVRHKIGNTLVIAGPGSFDLKDDTNVSDLGPDQKIGKSSVMGREVWHSMILPSIKKGGGQFFVFGKITYSDVFTDVVRTTQYRFRVDIDDVGKPHFAFCDEGNTTS